VTAIASGRYHALALKDGKVIAWGDNGSGQTTVPVEAQSGVTVIASGPGHCLALT
jgi:alpha-tubulin suppressor-like RCC1 family protein